MIAVLAACSDEDNSEKEETDEPSQEADMEIPEPDLEGIPDVVAEIDGEEVTKEEFEAIYQQQFQQEAMQAQMSGQEVDEDEIKERTAEGMVGQELLIAEANNRISDVSEDEINETIDELVEQNGMGSEDELFEAFAEQGMEKEELMEDIELQVKVEQLVAEEAGDDIEPTDEEAKEAYEDLKAQQEEMDGEEEIPEYDEIKSDLIAQLKQQKEAEVVQDFVDKLRKDADVTIHL